jgi:hypothetical protein
VRQRDFISSLKKDPSIHQVGIWPSDVQLNTWKSPQGSLLSQPIFPLFWAISD